MCSGLSSYRRAATLVHRAGAVAQPRETDLRWAGSRDWQFGTFSRQTQLG